MNDFANLTPPPCPSEAHEQVRQELAELRDMIERSGLYETDGYGAQPDSCGKPVYVKGKRILVCKRRMELEQEKTKLLQELANKARAIANLQELVRTANT